MGTVSSYHFLFGLCSHMTRKSPFEPTKMASLKKRILKPDLSKYDPSPLYLYTEKDSLNRVTVLKETAKEIYLIAGRYSGVEGDARLYTPLTDEEKGEIERYLRGSHKDALINHL